MGGAMSNPHEYREIMKAAMRLDTSRTVDEVLAEQKHRHEAQSRERRPPPPPIRGGRRQTPKAAATTSTPTPSQVKAIEALRARAVAVQEAGKK